ncbi:glycopeptide [Flagelloscypha sp. PMI_526]|nr:glycopeptide [Flagelloscypha sp. PMI_526]
MFSLRAVSVLALALTTGVLAESHTVTFVNRCQSGTPLLVREGKVVSQGEPFTATEAMPATIAYLQTGKCDPLNGSGCMTVELTLKNPDPNAPGSGSSVDLSLIPPLAFSVPTSFRYVGGCSDGASCASPDCPDAFRVPSDTFVQRACQANDVGLEVTFC